MALQLEHGASYTYGDIAYRTDDWIMDVCNDLGRIETANKGVRESRTHRIDENIWVMSNGTFKAHENRSQRLADHRSDWVPFCFEKEPGVNVDETDGFFLLVGQYNAKLFL